MVTVSTHKTAASRRSRTVAIRPLLKRMPQWLIKHCRTRPCLKTCHSLVDGTSLHRQLIPSKVKFRQLSICRVFRNNSRQLRHQLQPVTHRLTAIGAPSLRRKSPSSHLPMHILVRKHLMKLRHNRLSHEQRSMGWLARRQWLTQLLVRTIFPHPKPRQLPVQPGHVAIA